MPEKENRLPSSPETRESEKIKDADYWNEKRGDVLVKNGFPRHALDRTTVMEIHELGKGDQGLSVVYGENMFQELRYEPFKDEEGFEEACRKTARHYERIQEIRIEVLDDIIGDLKAKIERNWIYRPQEREGTYAFEEELGRAAPGAREALSKDEIQLIAASLRRRMLDRKLLAENLDKEAVGLDSPQIFEASDKTIIHVVDRFDHKMKKSEKFDEEEDFWVLCRPEEPYS